MRCITECETRLCSSKPRGNKAYSPCLANCLSTRASPTAGLTNHTSEIFPVIRLVYWALLGKSITGLTLLVCCHFEYTANHQSLAWAIGFWCESINDINNGLHMRPTAPSSLPDDDRGSSYGDLFSRAILKHEKCTPCKYRALV